MDQQHDMSPAAAAAAEGELVATPKPRRTRRPVERVTEPDEAPAIRSGAEKAAETDSPKRIPARVPLLPIASDPASEPPVPMLARRLPIYVPLYATALCTALALGGILGAQFKQAREEGVAAETSNLERALPWKREVAERGSREQAKLVDDVRALRGELAALRTNNDQFRQAETQKQVQELRALRVALDAQKVETASLKADLAARYDRADRTDRETVQRVDKTADRIDRLEKRLSDPTTTSTVAKTEPPKAEKGPVKGIVLREAMKGVALVETRRGLLEVVPGDTIPGAGRVETIEKRAGRWRVVTTTGVIDDIAD